MLQRPGEGANVVRGELWVTVQDLILSPTIGENDIINRPHMTLSSPPISEPGGESFLAENRRSAT